MNTKLIKLLIFACIVLCLVIAGEWLYASYARHRLLVSINEAKLQDYQADELPQMALSKQPEESYVDLVTRPLFIKGRRPVDEPTPESAQAAAANKPDSFDWQLDGIYSTKKTVSALFSRTKAKSGVTKDKYRKIKIGDELDDWKLTDINKDGVLFKQGNSEKSLLLRKAKSKALPPTPAPVPIVSPFSMAVPRSNQPAPAPTPFPVIPVPELSTDTAKDTSEDTQQ